MRTAAHEWAANGTRRISQGLVAAKALAIGNQSTISLTSLANGAPKHGRESRLPALERQKLSFEPSPSPFPSGYILLDRRIDRPVPGRPAYTPSIAHRMSVQGAESKAAKPISMHPSFHSPKTPNRASERLLTHQHFRTTELHPSCSRKGPVLPARGLNSPS
jgi:hypothetical protein